MSVSPGTLLEVACEQAPRLGRGKRKEAGHGKRSEQVGAGEVKTLSATSFFSFYLAVEPVHRLVRRQAYIIKGGPEQTLFGFPC